MVIDLGNAYFIMVYYSETHYLNILSTNKKWEILNYIDFVFSAFSDYLKIYSYFVAREGSLITDSIESTIKGMNANALIFKNK